MFTKYCQFTSYLLRTSYKMDKRTINLLLNKVCSFERTISTLQNEVQDIKRILQTAQNSSSSNSNNDEPNYGNPKFVITTPNEIAKQKKRKLSNYIDLDQPDQQKNAAKFKVDQDGYVQVFTDGACENNGKKNAKAGLGVWFGHNHPLNLAEPVKRRPTNNVGEIEACTRAIQQAHSKGITKLCINTDSEFTINCITKWIHGWKKRNWINATGKPVINKDELMELENAIQLMEHVKWNHVRGHRGIVGNEAADELARRGAIMYKTD